MNNASTMGLSRSQLQFSSVKGFTLIELLVSIVIVGLLSAIALPSYFNQAAKARSGEGRIGISTINRAQVSYRLRYNALSADLENLDTKLPKKFYEYSLRGISDTFITATATTSIDNIKGYSGAVSERQVSNNPIITGIICETRNFTGIGNGAPTPIPSASLSCPGNTIEVE